MRLGRWSRATLRNLLNSSKTFWLTLERRESCLKLSTVREGVSMILSRELSLGMFTCSSTTGAEVQENVLGSGVAWSLAYSSGAVMPLVKTQTLRPCDTCSYLSL